jgi:type I restriction enzyme, R subunit
MHDLPVRGHRPGGSRVDVLHHAARRGESLGLTDDEVAFYHAVETNDSAVQVLGDESLRRIARELVAAVREARLRARQGREAQQTVLEQAEVLSEGWAEV